MLLGARDILGTGERGLVCVVVLPADTRPAPAAIDVSRRVRSVRGAAARDRACARVTGAARRGARAAVPEGAAAAAVNTGHGRGAGAPGALPSRDGADAVAANMLRRDPRREPAAEQGTGVEAGGVPGRALARAQPAATGDDGAAALRIALARRVGDPGAGASERAGRDVPA